MRSIDQLIKLQQNPANIRNVCILAHVDHGKTTLADYLLASNGIIHPRSAGKIRFMDNRKDEQERGITMKSSAVALHHHQDGENYLINLIDSPGHVDFSGEVSTAVRLCDGAIVVVDAVEGVCPQTKVVLQQVWKEHIHPVLVINKIDRLILERKLSPLDAYVHLQQVLEQVNAVIGELLTTSILGKNEDEQSKKETSSLNEEIKPLSEWSSGLEDVDDSTVYFSPELGNVIFASALDGWGFRISSFASFFAAKLGMKEHVLNKTLWGDYYLDSKAKKVMKGAQAKAKKPLFVQLILENIWAIYESIVVRRDKEKVRKIADTLNIRLTERDARQTDPKVQLTAVCGQWLPLSKSILDMVCELVPAPTKLPEDRIESLMCTALSRFDSLPPQTQALKADFKACSSSAAAPTIVCISKMIPFDCKSLPDKKEKPLTNEELQKMREIARQKYQMKLSSVNGTAVSMEPPKDESLSQAKDEDIPEKEEMPQEDEITFIAFARVFSGSLSKGQKVYILGPKYSPAQFLNREKEVPNDVSVDALPPDVHVVSTTVKELYLLMGRDVETIPSGTVPSGNLVGIGGLESYVLKSATLSTTLACSPFTDLHTAATPILTVALEPANISELPILKRGLKLLNQADPCVQAREQETGELVLVTAGEVHLERCITDLRERFAKIEFNVSSPIVPFRETIIPPPKMDHVNEIIEEGNNKKFSKNTSDRAWEGEVPLNLNWKCLLRIRALPLPEKVTSLLADKASLLKALIAGGDARETLASPLTELKEKLHYLFQEAGWENDTVEHIWSFGPRRNGPNILLNRVMDYPRPSVWDEHDRPLPSIDLAQLDGAIVTGFQVAALAGPMCEEPMMGVCFVIEKLSLVTAGADEVPSPKESFNLGVYSGQIIYAVKEGCRKSFQAQPQRLMAAMYTCDIQVNAVVQGRVYAVLARRHGRVISGDLREGSQEFQVTAVLPVIESFHLAQDLRKQTSGMVSPQLRFSHWEVVEDDPYWEPTTEEEYAHFGEKADSENRALQYVNQVRKRKGLRPLGEKIVAFAEKQRTLTKNK